MFAKENKRRSELKGIDKKTNECQGRFVYARDTIRIVVDFESMFLRIYRWECVTMLDQLRRSKVSSSVVDPGQSIALPAMVYCAFIE